MKAFRSFGRLGSKEVSLNDSRVNSQTDPLLPSSSSKPSKPLFPLRNQRRAQTSPEDIAANIAKRKRAKYPHVQPPPPLANELELMQFTGGGTIDRHAKRVMDDQAKAAAGSGRANMGIADVYRDEKGRIWWDQDEELEYRHLLDGVDKKRAEKQVEEINWENFDIRQQPKENSVMVGPLFDRRNSASSSVESDHDPKFLLEADESPTFTSGSLNDRILVSSRFGGANMSSLSLPSRTMRVAPHLVKPRDPNAFGEESRQIDRISVDFTLPNPIRERGSARRRSSPLIISPYPKDPSDNSTPSLHGRFHRSSSLRQEFLQDSFTPPPSLPPTRTTSPVTDESFAHPRRMKLASSSLSIRSLFIKKSRQVS